MTGVIYDGTSTPSITVSFDTGATGLFVLGLSTLGSTNQLGIYAPNWSAIPSDDIRAISTRRGRSQENQAIQSGALTLILENRSGNYDPDNITGPYVRDGYTLLTRGLGIKLDATWGGVTYPQFVGQLERVDTSLTLDSFATFTITDALAWLGTQDVAAIPDDFAGDTTATRAGRILDAVSWAGGRLLTGSRTMTATPLGATALSLIENTAAAEFGRLYVNMAGDVVLQPWESQFDTTMRLTLSDDLTASGVVRYEDLQISPGSNVLANNVTVVQSGDVSQAYVDGGSQARFGNHPLMWSAQLDQDVTAQNLARIIAARYAYPVTRITSVSFLVNGLGALFTDLLQTDIGDRVMVCRTTIDGRSRLFVCLIESIAQDMTPNGWQVTLGTSPGGASTYFVLGTSTLNGTDGLYY